jgi:hypothetical protein
LYIVSPPLPAFVIIDIQITPFDKNNSGIIPVAIERSSEQKKAITPTNSPTKHLKWRVTIKYRFSVEDCPPVERLTEDYSP